MIDWKDDLSDYDKSLINEIESKLNLDESTIQFPIETADLHTVDFSLERGGINRGETFMVLKHFIEEVYQGTKPIRILDIGANSMTLDFLLNHSEDLDLASSMAIGILGGEKDLKYPISGHISRLEDTIVCANDFYGPPEIVNWLNARFVLGDFLIEKTKRDILSSLGGNPDIIFGRYVFIENLGEYQFDLKKPLTSKPDEIGEKITKTAWELLKKGGYMVIDNGSNDLFGKEYLPEPLKKIPLSHFYWDCKIQIYQKK